MKTKEWCLCSSPSEKDEFRWQLKLRVSQNDLDEIASRVSLEIGGPFVCESEDFDYVIYIYGVKEPDLAHLRSMLESNVGPGKIMRPDNVESEEQSKGEQTKKEEVKEEVSEEPVSEPEVKPPSPIEEKQPEPEPPVPKKPVKIEPLPSTYNGSSLELSPLYTFEQLVIGPNNRFTAAAAKAVADGPGKVYNPFFIYGGVGLGKTHVMQSVGHSIMENDSGQKMMYTTAEKFMSEVIEGIRRDSLQEMRDFYKRFDLFLIDDIQFLVESESTQEEFFHIFNFLHQSGKQIIITSDRHPKKLNTLEDRLRSRFEWGLIADIKSPSLETRLAILRKKMDLYGIDLDDNILHFIASNLKSNVRELEGFLKRVSAYASLTQQEITMESVTSLMEDMIVPAHEPAETEAQKPKNIGTTINQLGQETIPPIVSSAINKPPPEAFIKPGTKDPVKTLKAAFFYPEGSEGDLISIKENFDKIIQKHKMKFKLVSGMEQTYVYEPTMKYSFFAESCKEKGLTLAVVLGPQTASSSESSEFSDTLQTLMNGETISLQFIPAEDVSKESRYLNMALDITLQHV